MLIAATSQDTVPQADHQIAPGSPRGKSAGPDQDWPFVGWGTAQIVIAAAQPADRNRPVIEPVDLIADARILDRAQPVQRVDQRAGAVAGMVPSFGGV